MGRIAGKVAFITGAARGQGRNHAVRLAEEGADIIAIDTTRPVDSVRYPLATAEDLAETVRLVEERDRRIVSRDADVRDATSITAAVEAGLAAFGRLDIVVANAGISTAAPLLELSEAAWDDVIDINLTGVWRTVKAAVPHLVAGGRGGSVVITSSLAAMRANRNVGHYSAAKAGLVMLAKVLALELAEHRIRVNTVHPTAVATEMILNRATFRLFRPDLPNPTRADFDEVAGRMNALGAPALEVDDVTDTVLHLVSDSGRYITGTAQVLDAGALL
ncbi:mycofactocin-coupled SDR family oxidoreductase [Pseudonocardia halophobica]|uniref:Oxidoreductase n=1 Tax=Pseudonocardia halophobica TaxID=29401 RepID=A0A9W6KYP6_9PSEU|nr:mycofactocin-coupled SDR family oxidoreductase [Pseudonocardia halophobica]GLL10547.1 oxidoreductase [Pseudonocardia halophobica]